jgi:hypothetical protein
MYYALNYSNTQSLVSIVRMLIKHGYDVNQADTYGITPVFYVIRHYDNTTRYIDLINLFLEKSVTINNVDKLGTLLLKSELEQNPAGAAGVIKSILNNRIDITNANLLYCVKKYCNNPRLVDIIETYKFVKDSCEICSYETNVIACNFNHNTCLACLVTINKYICEVCRMPL